MDNIYNDWYRLNNEMNEKNKELKLIKSQINEMTEVIIQQMIKNKVELIDIGNGKKLQLVEKKSYETLNKDYLINTLKKIFEKSDHHHQLMPDEKAEITTNEILEMREQNKKYNIKISGSR